MWSRLSVPVQGPSDSRGVFLESQIEVDKLEEWSHLPLSSGYVHG